MDSATGFALYTSDIVIIAASILAVVAVGLWASRGQDKTARGFFLASGRLPWYIVGAAFVSTSVSSEQIVGTNGAAYKFGMGVANWEWYSLPTYTLLLVFFIPVYMKSGISTVPELLTRRFGALCGDIYSWTMLAAYVLVFLVPILYGGSIAFSGLTGWNFYVILWVAVVLVGLYCVKGGLASVMWTDAVQCLMLVGGGVLLFFTALAKIPGDWGAMMAANPERFHLYHPPGDQIAPFLGLLMATFGVAIFYQAGNQVMIQRVLGARSTWDGMLGIVFAGFINLIRPLVTCFLGFIVFYWIHNMHRAAPLAKQDLAFPFALAKLGPSWGLRGIVLAGFLAAVMSTISALANSTATIFSLDVYRRLINRSASDRALVTAGRLASITSLAIAATMAPLVDRMGGIFQYFQTGVTYLATPFISVIILGILWKRANYQGALFGLAGGLVIQILVAISVPALGYRLHWFYVAFIAQVMIMAGVVIVSLATPAPAGELWRPFAWSPSLLSGYDEKTRRPWYHSLKLWFALYAALWIYLYWRFW